MMITYFPANLMRRPATSKPRLSDELAVPAELAVSIPAMLVERDDKSAFMPIRVTLDTPTAGPNTIGVLRLNDRDARQLAIQLLKALAI